MSIELAAQRRITKAFIDAHPVQVVLIPRVPTKTGTGTKLVDQTPRSVQTVRLIDQSGGGGTTPGVITTLDGQQRKVEFQMLGTYDADFGLYDYWLDSQGVRLEVAELLPANGYEQRAQVVRYGQG